MGMRHSSCGDNECETLFLEAPQFHLLAFALLSPYTCTCTHNSMLLLLYCNRVGCRQVFSPKGKGASLM
jgi:hypothetical protein